MRLLLALYTLEFNSLLRKMQIKFVLISLAVMGLYELMNVNNYKSWSLRLINKVFLALHIAYTSFKEIFLTQGYGRIYNLALYPTPSLEAGLDTKLSKH